MSIPVPSFTDSRVLVVGDVMLDHYWHGDASRISPEAPVPVVHVHAVEKRPGGAANVAMNVASLGAHPMLIGVCGEDDAGRQLQRLLEAAEVEPHLVLDSAVETVTKMRVLSRHQQLIRLDIEGTLASGSDRVAARFASCLSGAGVAILSDYAKGTLANPSVLIRAAIKAGVPVLVDPKGRDFSRYAGATLITPNLAEFEAVVGVCQNLDELAERATSMLKSLSMDAVLVTRGEHGMSLIQPPEPALHMPARAREVYDVTGAGDTVIAVLGAMLAKGESLRNAAVLANIAGGLAVGKLGAASLTREELARAALDDQVLSTGVLSELQALDAVSAARLRRESVVMTNGCFDLLHLGHVEYLEAARRQGDRLLIAVNDDASVRRLKGNGRPINGCEARMRVLASMRSVDWVVPFSEDTPQRLIELLSPDVLVKGGDYRIDQIVGAAHVQACGGRVEVLDFVDGYSTSSLIKRALDATTQSAPVQGISSGMQMPAQSSSKER